MSDEVSPAEAAQALADIQLRQQQVIDLAMIPAWYWWAVGALMVVVLALLAQPVSATVAANAATSHLFLGMVTPSGVRVDWVVRGTVGQLRGPGRTAAGGASAAVASPGG